MDLPGKDIYGVGLDNSIRKIQMDFRQYVARSKGGLALSHLKRIFTEFDKNGNGQLELDEFEKCLTAFGVFLKKYEYQLIFKFYDADKNGTLDFNEFLNGVKMPLNERRRIFVEKIFASLDRDGSGQIGIADISNRISFNKHSDVLRGTKTEDEMKSTYLGQFEGKDANGSVSLEEFIEHYQDISMGIPNDNYFIQLLEEQWSINENDLQQIAQQSTEQSVQELRQRLIQLSAGNKDDVIISKIYTQYDANKDGYIGMDELKTMMEKLEVNFSNKYLTAIFSKIDTNHSGFIEFQEFFDFIVHGQ